MKLREHNTLLFDKGNYPKSGRVLNGAMAQGIRRRVFWRTLGIDQRETKLLVEEYGAIHVPDPQHWG